MPDEKRIKSKKKNKNEIEDNKPSTFLSFIKKWEISDPMAFIGFVMTRLWFLGVFIYLSIFVTKYWDKCITFTCVDAQMNVNLNITGYNILFIVFIIMLILPLIKTIKISPSGIEASKNESTNAIFTRKADDSVAKAIAPITKDDIEQIMNNYKKAIGGNNDEK